MNAESIPASAVLFIYDITALKSPWAESKVWYWLAATGLMPETLKATGSQSNDSNSSAPRVILCKSTETPGANIRAIENTLRAACGSVLYQWAFHLWTYHNRQKMLCFLWFSGFWILKGKVKICMYCCGWFIKLMCFKGRTMFQTSGFRNRHWTSRTLAAQTVWVGTEGFFFFFLTWRWQSWY